MKIRYITIIYTILMLCCLGYFYSSANDKDSTKVDMATLNANIKNIENQLEIGISPDELEKKYDCSIIFRTDDNYTVETNNAVANNKIIFEYEKDGKIIAKIIFKSSSDILDEKIEKQNKRIITFAIIISICCYLLLFLIYLSYIRPFNTLKIFSSNIAKGNFDFPLPMKKNNYFGSFTESFDIMREELITARENEQAANRSKKELVAELSHDMKTPIATIKATCEVTRAKLQKNIEETTDCYQSANEEIYSDFNSKIEIIEQKADMIDQLISNMFHASLEELQNLQVEPTEEPSTLIQTAFEDINFYNKIHFKNEIPECLLYMDALRLNQVIDNIINNSYKYANTDIEVSYKLEDKKMMIEIKDFGPGVADTELPLITEKFFRGANKSGKNGSGLGLYLANYFMENMNGGLHCYNDNGFVVQLFLNKV